jgi:hypothetical protein
MTMEGFSTPLFIRADARMGAGMATLSGWLLSLDFSL